MVITLLLVIVAFAAFAFECFREITWLKRDLKNQKEVVSSLIDYETETKRALKEIQQDNLKRVGMLEKKHKRMYDAIGFIKLQLTEKHKVKEDKR